MNLLELDKQDGSLRCLIHPDNITHIQEERFEGATFVRIYFVNGLSILSNGTYETAKAGWEMAMRNR